MKYATTLLLLLSALNAAPVLADEVCEVNGATCTPVGYDTMDAAATAAEAAAMSTVSHYEFGGAIYTANGKFYFTPAQTSNDRDHIKITAHFSGHLVAIYHTHPGNVTSDRYFSQDDVDVATRMKVMSYIGVTYDKTVHKFVPGVTHTERSRENGRPISLGEVIS